MPPRPPRAATSSRTAATWADSAGLGSPTQAGSRPTIQVLVPESVRGDGLSARMRRTSVLSGAPAGRLGRPAKRRTPGPLHLPRTTRARRRAARHGPGARATEPTANAPPVVLHQETPKG